MTDHSEHQSQQNPRRLSRDEIVAAGLQIVRIAGEDALSMRAVARHLNCGTMSLYHYVQNREDLLQGMLDRVASGMRHPDVQGDPIKELTGIFMLLHRTFHQEPWIVRVIVAGDRGSAGVLPLIERALAALAALGMTEKGAWQTYHLLLDYCVGEALVAQERHTANERRSEKALSAAALPMPDPTQFPRCMKAVAFMGELDRVFEENLARFLENTALAETIRQKRLRDLN